MDMFPTASRPTGLSSALGKCSATLKTDVPDSVKDDFDQLARKLGMDTSRLLRMLILTRLYGVERVAMLTAQEVVMAAGTGTELSLKVSHPGESQPKDLS